MICQHLPTVEWFQVLLCMTNNSIKHQLFVYTQLKDQTVLFLTIQFSMRHLFAQSWNVKQFYLSLSGTTTPVHSGPGSNSSLRVLYIPQNSRAIVSPSDCLGSYPGHSFGKSFPNADTRFENISRAITDIFFSR